MAGNKIFLLDAFALIYRAHFAFSKNPRVNSKGFNTGCVLGFTNTLLEVIQKEKPDYIGVGFDLSGPTFRHVEYVQYKAQRQEQPEDITCSIPVIRNLIKAFNIPILEMQGYEADDVIGTIAKKAAAAGLEVYMMTPDKDYSQLVQPGIYLYKPNFMGKGVEVLDEKAVLEKWEIQRIDQVTDILGLQGDAVDNIPGIPGIGAKTAVKLIAEYGSVENLIANASQLKGKLRENVENFAAQGLLSKKLATIHTEVPVNFDIEDLRMSKPDREKVVAIFDEMEFRTLKARMFPEIGAAPAPGMSGNLFDNPLAITASAENEDTEDGGDEPEAPAANYLTAADVPHEYRIADTPEKLEMMLDELRAAPEFCFDSETTSLDPIEAVPVGLSFSTKKYTAWYLPLPADNDKETREILQKIAPVLGDPSKTIIGQNIKYDILVLKKYGIEIQGFIFDTMVAHYLIEPEMRHNMNVLAENYLNYSPISIETLIGKKGKLQGNMADAAVAEVAEYAGEDADITLQLKHVFAPMLAENRLEKLYREVEAPLIQVLADMEAAGVKIDEKNLEEYSKQLKIEADEIETTIYEQAGEKFNIGSPKQLGEILFEKMKLIDKPKKTKTGQYATGEDVLTYLANDHAIINNILTWRELNKLKSTYVDALPKMVSPSDGRVHTSYNQTIAATGRLSSVNPNLQNIPIRTDRGREIRKAFVARSPEYVFMSADYSQIELRIMASLSGDPGMMESFRQGIDIHTGTASKVFGVPVAEVTADHRRKAKMVNFGIIYGISAFGLSQRLGIPRGEAKEIIDAYFEKFAGVKAYMDRVVREASEKEYVETILGRRRYLRDINSRNQTVRGFAERNAINAPIQGSAADMIKLAMINIHRQMKKDAVRSKMVLQVHDELIFDVHRDEVDYMQKMVPELMKTALVLDVPLEVETGVGANWLEAH